MDATTPPPNAIDDETRALLALNLVPGIGPRLISLLMDRFGGAQAVFNASEDQRLSIEGLGPSLNRRLQQIDQREIDRELARCDRLGISLSVQGSSHFPKRLQQIHDAPPLLYVQGEIESVDNLGVAIVGTRRPTRYGIRQAERLAAGLARCGLTVVSGLARGIDAVAHEAALSAGGRTLAVMAGGLEEVYPPEHEMLAKEVQQSGALISEVACAARPRRGAFPRRNRLISGMSLGVIVVEAMQRSGALITARHAMEQDREVFAVPGEIDSKLSRGCHQLIRDGAKLIESVEDVLDELTPLLERPTESGEPTIRHPAEMKLNAQERAVYAAIENKPISIEEVAEQSGLPIQRVLATLSVLETRRLIDRLSPLRVVRRS